MYCVYLIGKNIKSGYIGVTNNPSLRFYNHSRSNYNVGKAIRKYKWKKYKILCFGDMKYCLQIEKKLRPFPNMGLNMCSGGVGPKFGSFKNSKKRSEKLSLALQGRKKSKSHLKKLRKTWRDGRRKGFKNGNAKKWEIINPKGQNFILHGNVIKFCQQKNIMYEALKNNLNHMVPDLTKVKSRGGFRPKNTYHLQIRKNTIGWTLREI